MTSDRQTLRLALPKGRMHRAVIDLLADAGIDVQSDARGYRPVLNQPGFEAKILKPQNIVEMLQAGSRDLGFAGADWVAEQGARLTEMLDTGLDRVRLVVAAPADLLEQHALPRRPLVVATEMPRLTARWIEERKLDARVVRTYGATEVFPPEDADCVVDISASGATLRANNLRIVDEIMTSSTRLYASAAALAHPRRREQVDNLVMLLRSVLEARARVMLEVNVTAERLETVIEILPCMREPTVSPLHDAQGFAVRAAVPRDILPRLIPQIKERGGTDLVVTSLAQIVP